MGQKVKEDSSKYLLMYPTYSDHNNLDIYFLDHYIQYYMANWYLFDDLAPLIIESQPDPEY